MGVRLPVSASSVEEKGKELLEGTDLTQIQEAMPEVPVRKLLEEAMRGEGIGKEEDWKEWVLDTLKSSILKTLPDLLRLCGYALLCLTLSLLSDGDGIGQMGQSLLRISALLLAISQISVLADSVTKTVERIASLCGAVTPTVSALLLAEGSVKINAVGQAVSLFIMEKLIAFVQSVLLPLLKAAAGLILLSSAVENMPMEKLCRLPLSCVKWSCGISFAGFLGLLTAKGVPAMRYDGVAVRAAKYAVEKLVPVIGGVFKETTDTLIGCVLLLKGAIGTVSVLGLLLILLMPAIRITVTLWGYKVLCALLEPMGDKVLTPFLGLLCEVLLALLIVLLTVGAIVIVFLAALTMVGGVL